jgi:demethylmenaquinone methyltransferase/2-methoxy-6-polyprenyl-1,4-benzoquinol methylase
VKATEARALFDRSARTYDPVNRAISLGLDRHWRRWVAEKAVERRGASVLDAMTGTGEVAVEAARAGGVVTAIDVSPEMLAKARQRACRDGVHITPVLADTTCNSELPPGPFDSVCVSFGLRYVDDVQGFLVALRQRVIPGGRLVVLEFCVPPRGLLSTPASFYFFRVLPRIGELLGGYAPLYRYLRESTVAVGSAADLVSLIESAGFEIEEQRQFGFGLVLGVGARPKG